MKKQKHLYSLLTVLTCLFLVLSQVQTVAAEKEVPLLLALVKAPELQKDLKLSDAEFQKFQSLFDGLEKIILEAESDIAEQEKKLESLEEIEKQLNTLSDRVRKETQNVREKLRATLSDEQYGKFSKRVVQVYVGMPQGYVFVDLFDALDLTDNQKQKLADHCKKHTLDGIRDQQQNLPAAQAQQREEESVQKFEQFMTAAQREKMNDLCLKLMPSYVRLLIFPEELTEYDSLHQPSDGFPRAMRLALKQEFLDGIRREAKLSSDESQRLLTVLQQTGKKFQLLYYDHYIALREGMKPDEALQTWIRGQAGIYTEFNKELQAFLTPEKRKLLQVRITQMASDDLITSFVFLCEEFEATNKNRNNAMFYLYKTIKAYRAVTNAKTPQEQQAERQKFKEQRSQYMKEFTADLTVAQQTMFISKILRGRPDYVNQITEAEDNSR